MIYIQYTNDILLIHNKNTKNSKNGLKYLSFTEVIIN